MPRLARIAALGFLIAAVPGPTAAEEELLGAAEAALAAGRYAEAERAFRAALAAGDDSAAAHLGLARALGGRERGLEGALHLARVGERRIREARAGEAIPLLEEAAALAASEGRIHALLGRARAIERRYLAAESSLRRAVELGIEDRPTLFYFGSTLWENGKTAEAEAILRRALAATGRTPILLHQLAKLLLWSGRYAEASELLREALRIEPRSADLRIDLAQALEGAGQEEEALQAYRLAVAAAPEHSTVRYAYALLLSRSGRREEAAREFEIYRRLYEEERERTRREGLERARIERGWELVRAGEAQAAVEHLESLPETADALVALAAAYGAAGEPNAAVAVLERAVMLAPRRQDLRTLLAEARLDKESGL